KKKKNIYTYNNNKKKHKEKIEIIPDPDEKIDSGILMKKKNIVKNVGIIIISISERLMFRLRIDKQHECENVARGTIRVYKKLSNFKDDNCANCCKKIFKNDSLLVVVVVVAAACPVNNLSTIKEEEK
ncbi:hypothetical protein RFI_33554, partial [Reticulomyxa filosa]